MTNTVEELCQYLIEGRARLLRANPGAQSARDWIREYTALVDETLRRIYHEAWAAARAANNETHHPSTASPEHEGGLALLAIGGYGRAELCPHSDIDIAFVPEEEEHPLIDAVVKEAFRLIVEVFIDGARLDVSYAYRPIADCERLDHTGKTALLEARLIAGSERLLRLMHEELHNHWDAVEFLLDMVKERREASRQLPLSLYAVEPHLKEGAGALREIHTALWVAGALLRTTAPLRELEWRGVVTAEDGAEVMMTNEFILRLRVWLHLANNKKGDVLRVDWQDRCARAFSYTGAGAGAAQNLLRDYYHHAEKALRFSQKVMRRLLEGPLPLDGHFVATHQRLGTAHPYTLRNHPELVMTPFVLTRKYGFTTDSELDRRIEEALPLMDAEVRRHSIARAGFLALLRNVGSAAGALSELRGYGVLQRFMPEFEAMLQLAPADPSHQLTVGEHSIHAIRILGEMWDKRLGDEEMYAVWDGVDDVELLVLGTLLHDVGKIETGSDHAVSGEQIAHRIGERLALSGDRIERLGLLVRRHLLLPRAARLRDLSAPATIREVIQGAGDVPTLKMLYLLSLADTCAVGERSYSNRDLEAMKELYERALIAMTNEETAQVLSDSEKREQLVQRERVRLRRQLRHLELDDATLHRLCDNLPASYILNTPLPTIATHLKFLDQLPEEKLIVDFYVDTRQAFTEMTVIAYDDEKPGLLSKICGVVYAASPDILTAHVFTVRGFSLPQPQTGEASNIVLDRLHLAANGRALSETAGARLAALLREVLLGHRSIEDVLQASGKNISLGITPHRIAARNDLSDEHTVISVLCDTVPGLLYHITHALAAIDLDIHTAKITSWGGRAEDAFYVTQRGADGRSEKISDEAIGATLAALGEKLRKPVEQL